MEEIQRELRRDMKVPWLQTKWKRFTARAANGKKRARSSDRSALLSEVALESILLNSLTGQNIILPVWTRSTGRASRCCDMERCRKPARYFVNLNTERKNRQVISCQKCKHEDVLAAQICSLTCPGFDYEFYFTLDEVCHIKPRFECPQCGKTAWSESPVEVYILEA